MNALLWRSEISSRGAAFNSVALESIWERILTSPDSSTLSIVWRGRRVGYCHCVTSAGEAWASATDKTLPEGGPKESRSFQFEADGSVVMPDWTNRLRFGGFIKADLQRRWQELDVHAKIRPLSWHLHSLAREQTLQLSAQEGEIQLEHNFKFSELSHPGALLTAWLAPFAGEFAAEPGMLPATTNNLGSLALGLRWEASEESLLVGHSQARVYRVQTRLPDGDRLCMLVSHVGEILRVELPGDWVLVNDQLMIP
jgi:hypothetical protein